MKEDDLKAILKRNPAITEDLGSKPPLKRGFNGVTSSTPIQTPPGASKLVKPPLNHHPLGVPSLLKRQSQTDKLKGRFESTWRSLGGQELETEFRFFKDRKWRADYAHRKAKVLIELEGGIWTGGAHNRGGRFNSDCEKYNYAAYLGYTVFRLTTDMIENKFIDIIIQTINDKLHATDIH